MCILLKLLHESQFNQGSCSPLSTIYEEGARFYLKDGFLKKFRHLEIFGTVQNIRKYSRAYHNIPENLGTFWNVLWCL